MESWYASSAPGWSVYQLAWLFVVYGFLGVAIETAYCFIREGVLESRVGVLYLPLRPMYGIGAVACTVLLDRFQPQPAIVFLGGVVICTLVEYVAGTVCDKVFGTLSWDYRSKVLHLHGKVCLQYSCCWGLLAGLTVYVLNPLIARSLGRVDATAGSVVLAALVVLTLACVLLTIAAWLRTGRRIKALQAPAAGMPVAATVSVLDRLIDRLVPDPLMINTFPRTRLTRELAALTGQHPHLIRWTRRTTAPDPSAALSP